MSAEPATKRIQLDGEWFTVEQAVLDYAEESAWLAAERYGADRSCPGCRKVMRHIDKRGDVYVCCHHRVLREAPQVIEVEKPSTVHIESIKVENGVGLVISHLRDALWDPMPWLRDDDHGANIRSQCLPGTRFELRSGRKCGVDS